MPGRCRYLSHFTFERMQANTFALYREVLSTTAARDAHAHRESRVHYQRPVLAPAALCSSAEGGRLLLHPHLHRWRSHGGAVRALGYRGQRMVSPAVRVPRCAVVGDRASPNLLVPYLLPIHVECDCDSIRSSSVNGDGATTRKRLSVSWPGD